MGAPRASVRAYGPRVRRINVTLPDDLDELLRSVARPGHEAEYVRHAIIEKAVRDELRPVIDQLRARVERVERAVGLEPSP